VCAFYAESDWTYGKEENGGLEKLNRRFAIWQKIQLNPFASWKNSDSLVTPCPKMQQSKSKLSPIIPLTAASSYN
jgi:hypothetical protein